MFRLYFIRHGQTEWNRIRRFQGQTDIELNDHGRLQAKAVAEELKDLTFDVIYSSDLSRAHETAKAINKYHKMDIVKDERLRERSFGCFEGHTSEETGEKFPELKEKYLADKLNFKVPGGESRREFIGRVGNILETIHERHSDQTIAVVSHGGVLGAMMSHIISNKLQYDSPQFIPLFTIQNCSISQLEVRHGQWLIHTLNEIHHLKGLVDEGRPVGDYA
jgi:alpha-ribazole phosphatase